MAVVHGKVKGADDKYIPLSVDEDGNIIITLDGETVEVADNPLETWVSGTLTLTNADTAYKIPSSEQAGRRLLILYNGSDTDMKIGASTITTSGILLAAGATMAIAAGANLYAACASAGKVLTYLEGK